MAYKKSVDTEGMIKWFSEINNKDVNIAGGKGASLGEMFNNGFPVPPGFVITAQAFDYFLTERGIKEKIREMISKIDMEDTKQLDDVSKKIRRMIEEEEIPSELRAEILEAYHILGSEKISRFGVSESAFNILKNSYEPVFVAVRSSATTEDLSDASFAGQQESFVNVKGDHNLIENVKRCFSSLYTPRAIYYRNKKGFGSENSLLAAVVQKMVDSEKSGVIFSKDPINLNDDIVVEAVFGLGEGIVSGKINPDHYVVSRELEVKSVSIANKKIAIVRSGSGDNTIVKLNNEKANSQVLSNGEILRLADYAVRLEEHYKKPQDIEFAVEENRAYIVQSRPITTLKEKKKTEKRISGNLILTGSPASPGIGVGVVKLVKEMKDLEKIKKGDVLVTEMTDPDMVVAMQKSVAIVTDEGGMTSHAAIVSREMGIPCVVGTGNATSVLEEGMKVTVDGGEGKVYTGEVAETKFVEVKSIVPVEKIRLKLILDLPDFVERAAESGIKDVGLQRIEGIIAESGKHPILFEKENNMREYIEILKKGIDTIAKKFDSVWIRTSDIRTDEFDHLKGAPKQEVNPMLGFHGIRFSLKHPKIFEAELEAISKVASHHPDKKFGVMFPQVISLEEVKEAKEYFNKYRTDNMEFGIMVETPAVVLVIEDICKEGIDFASFGTNDLTQFTLAIDRGNENVQYIYNEMNPAVLNEIKRVISVCKRYNVKTSICGQAGSRKEMIEFLFREGIDSISVNADAAYGASVLINELEKRDEGNYRMRTEEESDDANAEIQGDRIEQIEKYDRENTDKKSQAGGFIKKPFGWSKSKWKRWKKRNKIFGKNQAQPDFNKPAWRREEKMEDREQREIRGEDIDERESDIDNLDNIEEVSEEIQREVRRENEIEIEKEKEDEENIEVEEETIENIEEPAENQELEADFKIEEKKSISELLEDTENEEDVEEESENYENEEADRNEEENEEREGDFEGEESSNRKYKGTYYEEDW